MTFSLIIWLFLHVTEETGALALHCTRTNMEDGLSHKSMFLPLHRVRSHKALPHAMWAALLECPHWEHP